MSARTGKKVRRCALCKVKLGPTSDDGLWLHPESECDVRITDSDGMSLDDDYHIGEDGAIYVNVLPDDEERPSIARDETQPVFVSDSNLLGPDTAWVSTKAAVAQLFASVGLPVLGGASGLGGWSSVSTYQKCPYLWQHTFGTAARPDDLPAAEALEIGDLVHVFAAIRYSLRIDPSYPLTPEAAFEFLRAAYVTPERLDEAWRVFDAYCAVYGDERYLTPLAVEELVVNPKTGQSCRWDLVVRLDEPMHGQLPGVYVINHKTTSRFTFAIRNQWRNDGQILGEWDLYHQLGYHRRWGPLMGVCVNLIGKQQAPQFERIFVAPSDKTTRDHRKSFRYWIASIHASQASGFFPRARAACVNRWDGLCDMFDHCAGIDPDKESLS